ncbi:GNAT family N-acetyltransferase [Lipomyces starkeyi]
MVPERIHIRPAEDADLIAITSIYGHHVQFGTASFETDSPTLDEMRERRAQLLQQGFPYLVVEEDGRVVGYAYASAYRQRAAYRDTVQNSVYLHPDSTKKGIGSRLLATLIKTCEQAGYRQMVAIVGDSGNIASIRLHESQGFKLVGTLRSVGYKHGRWLDTTLLQRPLGFADSEPPTLPQAS